MVYDMHIKDFRELLIISFILITVGILIILFFIWLLGAQFIALGVLIPLLTFVTEKRKYKERGNVNYYIANSAFLIRIDRISIIGKKRIYLRSVLQVNKPEFKFKRKIMRYSVRDITDPYNQETDFWSDEIWDIMTDTYKFKNDKEALLWYKLN
jgi:hypothetical protein